MDGTAGRIWRRSLPPTARSPYPGRSVATPAPRAVPGPR